MISYSICANLSSSQNSKIISSWRSTRSWNLNTINNLLISNSYWSSYRVRMWKLSSFSICVAIIRSIISSSCRRLWSMQRRKVGVSNSSCTRDKEIRNRANRSRKINWVQRRARNHLILTLILIRMQRKKIKKCLRKNQKCK